MLLHYIPGVPIFFFVSGFLISKSFENNSSLWMGIGNNINPILFFILALLVFSIAYSKVNFSNNILKRNDISVV